VISRICSIAVALLAAAPAPAHADVADIAQLFPKDTLAFAEVRDPATAARVVGGWAKGTPFEDGIKLTHDRRDAIKDYRGVAAQQPVGVGNLLVSPEFLREIGRFRGAAVGLTGFTDKHEPNVAAVVLFGDSAAGALLAKAYLTTSQDLRRIDTIDGVAVFQHRAFPPLAFGNDGKPVPFENGKPTEGRFEATYAYRPGLFVLGSNKAAVADVLARFAGKKASPSLEASPDFAKFGDDRKRPGAFVYAVPPALVKALDAIRKAEREAVDDDSLAVLNFVCNPKAVPVVAGNLVPGDDEVMLSLRADLAPGQSSPLLALLAGSIEPKGLATPGGTVAAATLALPKSHDRVKAALAFADACAKASGALGRPPSEECADWEKRSGVPLRDGILRKLIAVSAVLPERQELPSGVSPLPLLVFHCEAEADAEALVAAVPKIAAQWMATEKIPQPSGETIQGVRVSSISAPGLPQNAPTHFAKYGTRVAIGLDRKWVARAAVGGGTSVADPTAGAGEGALFGSGRLGSLVEFAGHRTNAPPERIAVQQGPETPPVKSPETDKQQVPSSVSALAAAANELPPVVLRVVVEKGTLTARLAVRGFRTKLPSLGEKLVLWLEQVGMESNPNDAAIPRAGLIDR
jgi:hypothetical protein